jgi:type I restriction-modification system DNA methylase subunit
MKEKQQVDELLGVVNKILEYFKIKDVGELGDKLTEVIFSNNKNKVYDEYIGIVGDLETDWIQKIFQYYKSNRDELKQDYTPQSMSKLLAELTIDGWTETVYDVCCGSGSLTIQLDKKKKGMEFICHELDQNVIPFLLFNLSIRNIEATVIRGNVITGEQFNVYKLTPTDTYSDIEEIQEYNIGVYDVVISNPPFNLDGTFTFEYDGIKSNKSSNTFFTLYCIAHCKNKCSLILPTGFITAQNKEELNVRKYMIDENILASCISNPGSFFESTATNTSIITIDKDKYNDNFIFINGEVRSTEWTRYQRGQFGVQTGRIYEKKFNKYSDEDIEVLVKIARDNIIVREFSVIPEDEEIVEHNYSFSPGIYFEVDGNSAFLMSISCKYYSKEFPDVIAWARSWDKYRN